MLALNKLLKIALGIVTVCFIATNLYLLYSDKSEIPKLQYVSEYERMTTKDFAQKRLKESFIAPAEIYTVYVKNEDAVDSWLVSEGEPVLVGQELATLNTDRVDGQRGVWESERTGLLEQELTLENMKKELVSLRSKATSNNASNVDRKDNVTEIEGKTKIELGLNIGFQVDVTQEGSYTQAISAIDQQLSDITRQLEVLDAQLSRDDSKPALISPTSGTVSNITRHGSSLSVDIYSEEQVLVTYVGEDEWQDLMEGQQAKIQGAALDQVVSGEVVSVSTIPTKENELLEAYQQLNPSKSADPLTYYEVRLAPEQSLDNTPFAANVNAEITIDEANDAVSIRKSWARPDEKNSVIITKLDENGRPTTEVASTPFQTKERLVITDGINEGDLVLHERALEHYEHAPQIYLSFPTYTPSKEEWKAYGWRNYLKAMLVK